MRDFWLLPRCVLTVRHRIFGTANRSHIQGWSSRNTTTNMGCAISQKGEGLTTSKFWIQNPHTTLIQTRIHKLTETETCAPSQAQVQNVPNRHSLIQASIKSITRHLSSPVLTFICVICYMNKSEVLINTARFPWREGSNLSNDTNIFVIQHVHNVPGDIFNRCLFPSLNVCMLSWHIQWAINWGRNQIHHCLVLPLQQSILTNCC